MSNVIDFDVNLISKIIFRPSYHLKEYVWRNEEIVPKFKRFLWFKFASGSEIKPEGFYERVSDYYGNEYWRLVDEYWLKRNIVKDIHIGRKEIWCKSYVEVSLGYKSTIHREFNTDDESKEWINKLKTMANKTFETFNYK